jgi:peptidoglycan/LPS O-acetylase OafA/YrhL
VRSVSHPSASGGSSPPGPGRPSIATVAPRAAAVLVAVEGVLLVALGVLLVVRGFGADTDNRARAEIGGAFAVLGGAALGMLGRALLARRRWARSPSIVTQVLCVPVAIGLLQGHKVAYGLPLLVVALVAFVALIAASAPGEGR